MRSRTPIRRWAMRGSAAAFTAVALTAGMQAALTGGAQASPHQAPYRVVNPYSPAYHHAYRHGVVPTIPQQKRMLRWDRNHPRNASANDLNYGGGIDGIGVTTGSERVYMVFYGSQWGTQSTNANGDVTLSGDPSGQAPYQQELYKGLGTGGELWSGVMTQYCQGVATGAQTCPASNTQHVAYPAAPGGVLAGVWVDESTASPNQATGHQLGVEAVNAAAHFGNTTAASNRTAQYIIVSPTGTHPDGYNTPSGQFCAWHDWNGDTTLSGGAVTSPYGDIAFTNSPYITDMGASCGQDFVNSNGTLDGVSIVNGHEYAETITDQNPAGGWTDSSGEENGDKCAWITPGTPGGSFDLSTGHGTFAMQTTWGNDGNSGAGTCQASHAIVTNPGNTVTVTNPGNQTGTVGTAVSLQIHATDSATGQTLTYSATGLPAGLSINSSSGLISGTPTTAGTSSVTVTATDTTNASGSASFTWTINPSGGGCTASQLLGNPGFESGNTIWSSTAGVIGQNGPFEPAHTGTWDAWLDGYGTTHTDTLAQSVTIPAACTNTTFSFWLHIDTAETTTTTAYDKLKVQVLNSSGTVLATLATFSNLNHASGYQQHSYSLGSFAGQTVRLKFTGTEDISLQTSFVIDDTAVNTS
jgi:hypothetical protein